MNHQMRRIAQEITDREVLKQILMTAPACRIAFLDGDEPYVVPLNFGWEWREEIPVVFLHCARQGRKLPLLKAGRTVCFQTEADLALEPSEDPCDWGMSYRSFLGWGIPEEVTEGEEKNRVLSLLTAKYGGPGDATFPPGALKKTAVFSLPLTRFSGKRSS